MPVKSDDPRVIAYMQFLDRIDALPTINDAEVQEREVNAVVAQAGEMLRVSGAAFAVDRFFRGFCPEIDPDNDEHVSNFQEGSAHLIWWILQPVMPGPTGRWLSRQLWRLSEGDDPGLLRRTKVRNKRYPTSGDYEDAKYSFVLRCAYDAGRTGLKYTEFVAYLADRVPGRRNSTEVKHIERTWLHAGFITAEEIATALAAGHADAAGRALTVPQVEIKALATRYSLDQILTALDKTSNG